MYPVLTEMRKLVDDRCSVCLQLRGLLYASGAAMAVTTAAVTVPVVTALVPAEVGAAAAVSTGVGILAWKRKGKNQTTADGADTTDDSTNPKVAAASFGDVEGEAGTDRLLASAGDADDDVNGDAQDDPGTAHLLATPGDVEVPDAEINRLVATTGDVSNDVRLPGDGDDIVSLRVSMEDVPAQVRSEILFYK